MHDVPDEERTDFPRTGSRARQWRRFEARFAAWLATPEGRFVTWSARQQIGGRTVTADRQH